MRQVDKHTQVLVLKGEETETLRIRYDNRGEPYREGISLEFREAEDWQAKSISVFLERYEVRQLRDLLLKLHPLMLLIALVFAGGCTMGSEFEPDAGQTPEVDAGPELCTFTMDCSQTGDDCVNGECVEGYGFPQERCEYDDQCAEGGRCVYGRCRPGCPTNNCSADFECRDLWLIGSCLVDADCPEDALLCFEGRCFGGAFCWEPELAE